MGSDYLQVKIDHFDVINGVEVPVDEYGHYLNWEDISEDRTKARELTSPYGCLHYAIGYDKEGDDFLVCFDYAELPDGRIVLHAIVNTDSGGFIEGFEYAVVGPEDAVAEAMHLTNRACDVVFAGDEHDKEEWNQDEYYFVRSVAKSIGIEPYKSLNMEQLRKGPFPKDLIAKS